MITLGIDTSGKIASVALCDNEKILCENTLYTKLTHSQVILPMVKQVMSDSEIEFKDIDAIAISKGPGSYTGLRIGIGAVKGICMGANHIKCAGISTLEAIAYNCSAFQGEIICVMKARPKVVYVGRYLSENGKVTPICDDIVCSEDDFISSIDCSNKIMLTGDYCTEIKSLYFAENQNVILAPVADRLQKASSLCMALQANLNYICLVETLDAAYLQATKAEKDKAHS